MPTETLKAWPTLTFIALFALAMTFSIAGDAGRKIPLPEMLGVEDVIDLEGLEDGETRIIRQQDRQITATRHGDTMRLVIKSDDGDEKTIDISCPDDDTCLDAFVVRVDQDPTKHFVALGQGPVSTRVIVSSDDEDGTRKKQVIVFGNADAEAGSHSVFTGSKLVFASDDGGNIEEIVKILGTKTLHCPKGDATLTLTEEDEGKSFFCPRHNIALEKIDSQGGFTFHSEVIVRTDEDEEREKE